VLGLFHAESAWLYRLDLPLVSPAGLALTPRQRQTLQLLLAGQSEKQIAARLSLSPNTVHHYIKAIHRHFRVSSRSELLARWVGR
jgi:DNA-binding CsgD family transcriptional regulator